MNFIFLLDKFYGLCNIPVHLYDLQKQKLLYSQGFSDHDPWREDPLLFPALLHDMCAGNQPFIATESDMIVTVLFSVPAGKLVTMGPVCLYPDGNFFSEQYRIHHRLRFSLTLPECDFITLSNAISFLFYSMTGKEINGWELLHINVAQGPTLLENNRDLKNYMLEKSEIEQQRYGYDVEKEKMQAVMDGDVETIRREITPDAIIQIQMIGEMSKIPKKQWEYSVVSSIVLSCRASIAGGLPEKTSYSLSDTLLQRLTQCDNFQEMLLLESEVRMTFAAAVNEYKLRNTNISCVEKAKSYILDHLNRSITLDDLANECGISKCHLCRKFKSATSQTVMEYLYTERIKAAQDLLRYSNKPISYIAEYLCFSSQSHFTSIFRKYTGQTPLQYRNKTE